MAAISKFTINSSSRTKLTGDSSGEHGVKNEGPYPVALQYKNDADSGAITALSAGYVMILAPGETVYMHAEDGSTSADDLCATCIVDSQTSTVRIWSAY
jgi:hypothetical protein